MFTEDFNAEISVRGRHRQAQTDLPIKHGYDAMPGWTRLGDGMPAHFVEHAPGDWALMVVASEPNQNVFTLNEGFAANNPGHTYTVSFDLGPAVYQGLSQVTTAEDELAIELLHGDGTVLKRHQVKPGKWEAQRVLSNCTFTYEGDGRGPLRFRISPVFTSGTRFYGAIDNLQVFGSQTEAKIAVRKRVADAERAREELERQRQLLDWFEGSIGIIDPSKGKNYPNGLSKVTSEIVWPEVGNGPRERTETDAYRPGRYRAYKTPYPIGRGDFLVSIRRSGPGNFSLYLMDLAGNRELIYSGKHNVWHAIPIRPRRKPPIIPDQIKWPKIGPNQQPLAQGVLFSADVFEGAPLLPKDKVKYLRVLQIDAKTYTPWMKTYQHSGPSISVTQADGVKRILGTTPVEADGSVAFRVPPGASLHFQLLDGDYRCIQTMRSFTGVMPGETRGCVGCHEGRHSSPADTDGGLAVRRGAQALTPPPWGAEVSIGYERFVQPVLDKHCGRCHQGDGEARAKLDLTFRDSSLRDPVYPSLPPQFKEPYVTLVGGGNNWYQPVDGKLINAHGLPASISGCLIVEGYRERTPEALATLHPMTHMSSASLLIERAMDEEHIEAKMDPESLRRLIGWVDTNGPYLGEEEIRQMPDPTPETMWADPVPVVKPRLRTAPRINRFNIRQDGDSRKIYLSAIKERP